MEAGYSGVRQIFDELPCGEHEERNSGGECAPAKRTNRRDYSDHRPEHERSPQSSERWHDIVQRYCKPIAWTHLCSEEERRLRHTCRESRPGYTRDPDRVERETLVSVCGATLCKGPCL